MNKLAYILLASLAIGLFSCVGEKQKLYQQQLEIRASEYDSLFNQIEADDSTLIVQRVALGEQFRYILSNYNANSTWAFFRVNRKELENDDFYIVFKYRDDIVKPDTCTLVFSLYNTDKNVTAKGRTGFINPIIEGYDNKSIIIIPNDSLFNFIAQLNDSSIVDVSIPEAVYQTGLKELNDIMNEGGYSIRIAKEDMKAIVRTRDWYNKFQELK